ncbi:MAG: glycerol-3-phosphate 1-O-acyltransferase PlsY [Phycisphaerae bacterium]|jgi:glycerol-3-phosphate acyltransferase PlsY
MTQIILIVSAYLLGSVPFGFLIAAAHGKDLRKIGSGNIGATNLSRALGKKWGYTCFALDMLKGFIPTIAAAGLIAEPGNAANLFGWLLVGIAAILGHVFPVYLKFKGGKGVATSFGVALGLWPYFTICAAVALVIWITTVLIFKYVSLASIIAAVSFPVIFVILTAAISSWRFADLWPLIIAAVGIPVLVIILHRQNIRRILAGTESKIL